LRARFLSSVLSVYGPAYLETGDMMIPTVILLLFALLPQTAPIEIGPDSTKKFSLDFTGLKADGSTGAVVAELEFQFTPASGAPVLVRFPLKPTIGSNLVLMKDALKAVPGGVYDVRARWFDQASQPSAFSDPPVSVKNTVNPPGPPLNVSVVGG
jgi:hypothetical protein